MSRTEYLAARSLLLPRLSRPHSLPCPSGLNDELLRLAPPLPSHVPAGFCAEAEAARSLADTAAPYGALAATLRATAMVSSKPLPEWARQEKPTEITDWDGIESPDPLDASVALSIVMHRVSETVLRRAGCIERARAARYRLRARLRLSTASTEAVARAGAPPAALLADLLAVFAWRDCDATEFAASPSAEPGAFFRALCAALPDRRREALIAEQREAELVRPDVCALAGALESARASLGRSASVSRCFASAAVTPHACERRLEQLFEFYALYADARVPLLLHLAPGFAVVTGPWVGLGPFEALPQALRAWAGACGEAGTGASRAVTERIIKDTTL